MELKARRFTTRSLRLWFVTAVVGATLTAGGCHNYAHTRGWIELQSQNVRIRTNLPQIYAEPFLERYQRARDAIAAKEFRCGFDRISEPVEVILLPGVYGDAFVGMDLSGIYFRPDEPLIELDPSIVVKSQDEDRDSQVFLHELTHRLIDECVPSAPTWLHEGLATFYETAILDGKELRVGYPPGVFSEREGNLAKLSNGDTVELIPLEEAPTFAELRSQDATEFYENHANYHAAWVAVHLMKLDAGFEARFGRYMDALSRGEADAAAWEHSFGATDVDDRYRRHLTAEYEFLFYPASVNDSPAEEINTLEPWEVALMLSTFYEWKDRRGARAARGYAKYARKANPSSVAPLLYLASLHAARGNLDRATKSLDSALASHPSNPDVLSAALQLATLRGEGERLSVADRRRAEALAGELTRRASSAFHYVALSSWALFNGEGAAALPFAERAIALDARNASAQVAAADAAITLGRDDLARTHLKAALGLTDHSDFETRRELQRRLEALQPSSIRRTP